MINDHTQLYIYKRNSLDGRFLKKKKVSISKTKVFVVSDMAPYFSEVISFSLFSLPANLAQAERFKSNLHYTCRITLKCVTSGGVYLRSLAPGQHRFEETSQRWRAVGNIVRFGVLIAVPSQIFFLLFNF